MSDNVRFQAFHNAIRILFNMGDAEIEDAIGQCDGDISELRYSNPVEWFIRLPSDKAQAIYEKVINPRQPQRLRDVPVSVYLGIDHAQPGSELTVVHGVSIVDGGAQILFTKKL